MVAACCDKVAPASRRRVLSAMVLRTEPAGETPALQPCTPAKEKE